MSEERSDEFCRYLAGHPRQAEQRSEPEGPRSRVPRGIQGSANPFHMPSGVQASPQSRRGFEGMSGPVEKSQRRVRTGLTAPQGERSSMHLTALRCLPIEPLLAAHRALYLHA